MRRTLAPAGRLLVLAVLLLGAPLGCSWLIGVSGDPVVTDGLASDGGEQEAGDAAADTAREAADTSEAGRDADLDAAGDAAQDAAAE